MKKKNIAMFLGAGASNAFNYPLTKDILKLIIEGIKEKQLFREYHVDDGHVELYGQLLKELLINLSPGLATLFENNSTIEVNSLPLVTDLLSQAEHFRNNEYALADFNFDIENQLLGAIKGINERWSLADVIILFEWAIIKVINKNGQIVNNKLNGFIEWVRRTNKEKKAYISIITSNYDFAIEWNLLETRKTKSAEHNIDYGFNWRDVNDGEVRLRPIDPTFSIYKLHGSIDWLKCPRCGFIYINPRFDIYDIAFSNKKENASKCHCNNWPLVPVLVTPSYSRGVKDTNLAQIWRNSVELLRKADEWIIVGYSLPAEDLEIKALFLRALKGRVKPPIIKVIQLSRRSEVKYDYFFGSGNYTFIDGGFDLYDFSQVVLV